MARIISSSDPWILFLIVFVTGVAAAGISVMAKRRRQKKMPGKDDSPSGTLVGAMLGLLAFMLGLSFSITESKFSQRRQLVVDQAQALTNCYLYTRVIPPRQAKATRQLLQEYMELLLAIKTPEAAKTNIPKLESIQLRIWDDAASLKTEEMDSELRSLYLSSVQRVVEIFTERKVVTFGFRIPGAIWTALLLLYLLSMFFVGTDVSFYTNGNLWNVPILAASFSLVVALVADMDASSRTSRFMVNQQVLYNVQNMMLEENKRTETMPQRDTGKQTPASDTTHRVVSRGG